MSEKKKPFQTLMGNRIVLENFAKPAKEEDVKSKTDAPSIILLPEDQKELDAEKMDEEVASTERFTILQVGEECNEKFKPGMEVYLEKPERVLSPENASMILEDGEILGFIIPERAIAGIY